MTFDKLAWTIIDLIAQGYPDKDIIALMQLPNAVAVAPEQLVATLRVIERRIP
jgi:hypothetical protein